MFHNVGKIDAQIQDLEKRLRILEQKLYLSKDSDEIIAIQIEKNQIMDVWKELMMDKLP